MKMLCKISIMKIGFKSAYNRDNYIISIRYYFYHIKFFYKKKYLKALQNDVKELKLIHYQLLK